MGVKGVRERAATIIRLSAGRGVCQGVCRERCRVSARGREGGAGGAASRACHLR